MIRSAIVFKYHRPPHTTTAQFCLLKAAWIPPPLLCIPDSKEKALCLSSSSSTASSSSLSLLLAPQFYQAGRGSGTLVCESEPGPASFHL